MSVTTQWKMKVDSMLSFELSAVDVVLLVAVMVLLLLFISQRRGQVATRSQFPLQDEEKILEKTEKTDQTISEEFSKTQSSIGFQKCVHHFGYLRNLPQNTPVPDECFGCPKVMRCLFPNE